MKKITIIGGGAAALMFAAEIDTTRYQVTLYEKKKSVGRKFLVAGEGGLNLTYSSSLEDLLRQYSPGKFMDPIIRQFTNKDLINWLDKGGIKTFVGSSNRVFPELKMKPVEVLNKILEQISANKIAIKLNTEWMGWNAVGDLCFKDIADVQSDVVVFATGGASWKVTGSDGTWSDIFKKRGIVVAPFRAANCAFGVSWNKHFITTHQGKPLKNIALVFRGKRAKGELVISKFGLEGNAIYALSEKIQKALLSKKNIVIHLDLKPTMTIDQLKNKYKKSGLSKITDILKADLNLDRAAIGLLKHCTDKKTFLHPDLLVEAIKSVPVTIHAADELDKAISTLGGVDLNEVDINFQLKKIPDTYIIGEMLDWYAPTGGYLLQGSFSMGFALAKYLNSQAR